MNVAMISLSFSHSTCRLSTLLFLSSLPPPILTHSVTIIFFTITIVLLPLHPPPLHFTIPFSLPHFIFFAFLLISQTFPDLPSPYFFLPLLLNHFSSTSSATSVLSLLPPHCHIIFPNHSTFLALHSSSFSFALASRFLAFSLSLVFSHPTTLFMHFFSSLFLYLLFLPKLSLLSIHHLSLLLSIHVTIHSSPL